MRNCCARRRSAGSAFLVVQLDVLAVGRNATSRTRIIGLGGHMNADGICTRRSMVGRSRKGGSRSCCIAVPTRNGALRGQDLLCKLVAGSASGTTSKRCLRMSTQIGWTRRHIARRAPCSLRTIMRRLAPLLLRTFSGRSRRTEEHGRTVKMHCWSISLPWLMIQMWNGLTDSSVRAVLCAERSLLPSGMSFSLSPPWNPSRLYHLWMIPLLKMCPPHN
mmetsp:Transcript_60729/g.144623  ORF Transcript_60729/g.144623 Transcript_60729/m.144623 type:complete len:219 (+) Transcript_60729:8368-9024(+)